MSLSRRGIFGFFAGALAAPYLPAAKPRPANLLVCELEFPAMHTTFTRYSGYETLMVSRSDIMAAAEYDWRQNALACEIKQRLDA